MRKVIVYNSAIFFLWIFFAFSCSERSPQENPQTQFLAQKIELIPCPPPDSGAEFSEITLMGFIYAHDELKFGVEGVTLGIKTPGAEKRNSQVSNKGVHLHVVINDSIHLLHYDNLIPYKLSDGTYKMAVFATRSYHESIKLPKASMVRDFQLRNGQTVKSYPNPEATLVYAAPLGEFKGADTENIVLDFFLLNTNLAPNGNRVRVLIDHQFEFFIDRWQTHYIKGLIDGKHSIQMELLNANGQRLYGPLSQQIVCKFAHN